MPNTAQQNTITKIRKRNGDFADFDRAKITDAIFQSLKAVGNNNMELAKKFSDEVAEILNKKFHFRSVPAVEEVQDIVEEVLISNREIKTAKAYILYRDQQTRLREMKEMINSNDLMDEYLKQTDW
ncbi:MAG TPA: ribonucleoside triphosphate reductase, partial [Ignavibacteria bacterium]|nr:ribonucleoside triphosphate reductase [Ignavibacteria bacterium]